MPCSCEENCTLHDLISANAVAIRLEPMLNTGDIFNRHFGFQTWNVSKYCSSYLLLIKISIIINKLLLLLYIQVCRDRRRFFQATGFGITKNKSRTPVQETRDRRGRISLATIEYCHNKWQCGSVCRRHLPQDDTSLEVML